MRSCIAYAIDYNGTDYKVKTVTVKQLRSGMTLVELLVVLAIVAIAAAALLPVFVSGRTAARRISCSSNMHQCSQALMMYYGDYDEVFPTYKADVLSAQNASNFLYWHDHFCRATYLQPNEVNWASLANNYLTSMKPASAPGMSIFAFSEPIAGANQASQSSPIFHCPDDYGVKERPVTSYEYKMWLALGVQLAQVSEPADMVMLWEQWTFHTNPIYSEHDRRGAMNVIYVDGHSHWLHLSDTTTALFGNGPDLHWDFVGTGQAQSYNGSDTLN